MMHWRTLAGEKRKHYIMPQFGACDKIGICMYLPKYKVLTVGVDHVLVCRQKNGNEESVFHILLLNLRDTYTFYIKATYDMAKVNTADIGFEDQIWRAADKIRKQLGSIGFKF